LLEEDSVANRKNADTQTQQALSTGMLNARNGSNEEKYIWKMYGIICILARVRKTLKQAAKTYHHPDFHSRLITNAITGLIKLTGL